MDRPATAPETAQQFVLPDEAVHEDFHRGLKERHIQMIAIGGAIGVGLFLGSAKAIQQAGQQEIIDHVRSRIAHYKAPDDVIFVDELPKNSAGKVQTFQLREAEAAKQARAAEALAG